MKGKWIYLLVMMLSTISLVACASATLTAVSNSVPTSSSVVTSAPASASSTEVNLNSAEAEQLLVAVPGLGNRMVREFQEYRPYVSIQQFRKEIGKYVDEAQVAEYEKYVYVPIQINDADAATLQQIPGLDASEADALIASRPYASVDGFLAKLSPFVSAEELAIAKT